DEIVDTSDPINTLEYLFLGKEKPECMDAADVDDSGIIDTTDAVYTLEHLFLGGQKPPAPYPEKGYDVTREGDKPDELNCKGFNGVVLLNKGGLILDIPNTWYRITQHVLGGYIIEGENSILDGQKANIILDDSTIEDNGIRVSANNIEVKDVAIRNYDTDKKRKTGILITGENAYVSNVEIRLHSSGSKGIDLTNTRGATLEDINIRNSGYSRSMGITGDLVDKLTIKNFNILTSGRGEYNRGISFSGCRDIFIKEGNIEIIDSIDSDALILQSCTMASLESLKLFTGGNFNPETNNGMSFYNSKEIKGREIEIITDGKYSNGINGHEFEGEFDDLFIQTKNFDSYGILSSLEDKIVIKNTIIQTSGLYDISFLNYARGYVDAINSYISKERVLFGTSSQFNPKLNVYWNLDARITDTSNNPLEAALVEGYDTNNNPIFSEYTNTDGRIQQKTLLSYIQDKDGIKYAYPHKIQISKPGYQTKNDIFDLTGNVDLRYVLEPTNN
ncbi:hypothetical protein HYV49_03525, partial [Candidatus Pacearchaeota archaeon]|nr:hypothetical protein [Candidatus Pacearchaeota archaeon]